MTIAWWRLAACSLAAVGAVCSTPWPALCRAQFPQEQSPAPVTPTAPAPIRLAPVPSEPLPSEPLPSEPLPSEPLPPPRVAAADRPHPRPLMPDERPITSL